MAIVCDANKLPEEVKTKAHKYIEKHKPQFRTFGISMNDVECAWLKGFAFCLEGTVEVKVKQCATCVRTDSPCLPEVVDGKEEPCKHYKSVLESYALLKKSVRGLVYCLENCSNNALAVARCMEQVKELII